jgi:hypothetical protein
VRTWKVGRYTATLTLPTPRPGKVASAVIEWAPHIPRGLTREELEQYRAGRDVAIRSLGVKALVIDL